MDKNFKFNYKKARLGKFFKFSLKYFKPSESI